MLRLAKSSLPNIFTLCFIVLAGCSWVVEDTPETTPNSIDTSVDVIEVTWDDCGGLVGDHPCDFEFTDQNDESWKLYDHIGKVILLDFSAEWCTYCKISAADVQAIQDVYGPDGFIWVTLLVDDATGTDVSLEEAQLWAETYGIITAPVLAADRSIIDLTAEDGYPISSWPTFVLIDRDMTIAWGLHGWSQELIIDAIENLLGTE